MHSELLTKMFKPKPETELTVQDARIRLEYAEGLAAGHQQKPESVGREVRAASWVVAYSRELLRDIEARDAGRFIEVRGAVLHEPCKSKNQYGDLCSVKNLARRVVVWTANGRVVATFCPSHKEHAAHFGMESCWQCGSEVLLALVSFNATPSTNGTAHSAHDGIPIIRWGRDHWAVFLHVKNLCAGSPNGQGYPDLLHIKCNPDRHPDMVPRGAAPSIAAQHEPVRLNDGTELPYEDYDGWDCMADVVRERLVVNIGTAYNPCYLVTERGSKVAEQVRQYRKKLSDNGKSRNLDNFRYQEDLALAV